MKIVLTLEASPLVFQILKARMKAHSNYHNTSSSYPRTYKNKISDYGGDKAWEKYANVYNALVQAGVNNALMQGI